MSNLGGQKTASPPGQPGGTIKQKETIEVKKVHGVAKMVEAKGQKVQNRFSCTKAYGPSFGSVENQRFGCPFEYEFAAKKDLCCHLF
eukprot:7201563-Karenia_brevis.AAC.1